MPQPRRNVREEPQSAGAAATAATGAGVGAATAATATAIPPAGAVVSAEAISVATQAAIAGLRRFWQETAPDDIFWLWQMLKREYPAEPEDELRALAAKEAEYGRTFLAKMEARLERDIPGALHSSNDPAAALRTLLERERRYIRQRQEAMLSRAMSAQERASLKRTSPAGAYWKLSPFVKSHTIDCLVMGGKFWPWPVLDVINPPRHPNCPCRLYGEQEAVSQGFLPVGFVPPPEEDGIALANELRQRFAELREAAADPEELDLLVNLMEEHRVGLNLSEAGRRPYDKRFAKGTVKGGEFMPKVGGFAAAVRGDLKDAVDALLKVGKGRGRGSKRPHGSALRLQRAPAEAPGSPELAHMPGGHGQIASHGPTQPHPGGPPNFHQWRERVKSGVDEYAERYGAKVTFDGIDVNPNEPDTTAIRYFDGKSEIGKDAPGYIEAVRENPDDPDAQSGAWLAYSRGAHEAVGHGVNPIDSASYHTPEGYALEEALAEEFGRDAAREWLAADGLEGASNWAEANPDHSRSLGAYRLERARLSHLLDEAGVEEGNRRGLMESMSFRQQHPARMNLLGGLIAKHQGVSPQEGRERARAILAGDLDEDSGLIEDYDSRLPVLPPSAPEGISGDLPEKSGDEPTDKGGAPKAPETGAETPEPPDSGQAAPPEDKPTAESEPVKLKKGSGPQFFDARHYSDPRRSLLRKIAPLKDGGDEKLEKLDLADGTQIAKGPKGSVRITRPDGTDKLYSTPQRLANAETASILSRHGISDDRIKSAREAAGVPEEKASTPITYESVLGGEPKANLPANAQEVTPGDGGGAAGQRAPVEQGVPQKGPTAQKVLGDAKDTMEKHTVYVEGVGRVYTPERQKLHAEILDGFLAGKTPPEGTPRVLFTAGAPGSGKSTILKTDDVAVPENAVEVNPDLIKEQLPEFQEMAAARDPWTGGGTHEESSALASELRRRAQDAGLNIVVDGVGNSVTGKFKRKLTEFHNAGYDVEAVVAHLPLEEGRKRVAERAERTGRSVPADVVTSYYSTVPKRFAEYAEEPWLNVRLYDTNVPRGEPAKLVAEKGAGDGELSVHDPAALKSFEELGRINANGAESADLDRIASRRGGLLGDAEPDLPGRPDAGAAGSGAGADVVPPVLTGDGLRDGLTGGGEVLRTHAGNVEVIERDGGWSARLLDQASPGEDAPELSAASPEALAELIDKPQRAPAEDEALATSLAEKPPAATLGVPTYDAEAAKLHDFKAAGGSNGAQMAKDGDGKLWLVKPYRGNRDRVATELLANAVYRELGIDVPDAGQMQVQSDQMKSKPKPEKLAIKPDGTVDLSPPKPAGPAQNWTAVAYPARDGEIERWQGENQELGEGFMADALLANWDVVGLSQDNVLWSPEGTPVRLDQGGTFEYRAQGQTKPFGPVPTEAWTMRSPRTGQAFGRYALNDQMLRDQAGDIAVRLTPQRVDDLVDEAPFADEPMRERIRENLKARVAYMGKIASGEEGLPGPLEGEEADGRLADDLRGIGGLYPEEEGAISAVLDEPSINDGLRSGTKTPENQKTVEIVDALMKQARSSEDLYVHVPTSMSGLGAADAEALRGKKLRDPGYVIASTDIDQADQGKAVLRILVPAGAPALGLGEFSTEPGAVLINRGQMIRIAGASMENGRLVVDAVLTRT